MSKAYFAELNSNNIVTQVIVINDTDMMTSPGVTSEGQGIAFCKNLTNSDNEWKQTSYDAEFRGHYAGIGHTYLTGVKTLGVASTDIFVVQQPFPSWTIDEDIPRWYAPITEPTLTASEVIANKEYVWNEDAYNADTGNPKTVGWALTSMN